VQPEGLLMKNSNDTIGNRTRDLLVCSAVSQPTGHKVFKKIVIKSAIGVQRIP
jgi:hypothetical protein